MFAVVWTIHSAIVAAEPVHPPVGHVIQTFALDAPDAMLLPTDVAVTSDGAVLVADGVRNRVVEFGADGSLRSTIIEADGRLRQPIGLFVDAQDHLWIADTGNRRVVRLDGARQTVQTIKLSHEPERDSDHGAPDLTDVVVNPSTDALWMVDNDRHRLLRHSLVQGTLLEVGQEGTFRGQFRHPFLLAISGSGRLLVSDVINGRVQVLSSDGQTDVVVDAYGLGMGQLYRPKGVAFGPDESLWITDGTQGVVQVFASNGTALGVLGTPNGTPLRLAGPMGLVFGPDGSLYVVESVAGRVVRVSWTWDVQRPQVKTTARRPVAERQPRACTLCHVEWVDPPPVDQQPALVEVIDNAPEHPWVSRPETCLSCHDGSVADSRRRVWQEHGHRNGVRPSLNVAVPKDLPLVDGALACRTCHSAHTRGGAGQTFRDAVFLRVNREPNELCVRCHTEQVSDDKTLRHPTRDISLVVPESLLKVGARQGHESGSENCLACHASHGGAMNALLLPLGSVNQLCLSCHDSLAVNPNTAPGPGHHPVSGFRADSKGGWVPAQEPRVEPVSDPISCEHAGATDPHGVATSELSCQSCHRVHRLRTRRWLLTESLDESALCISCHDRFDAVLGSKHDLSVSAWSELNSSGLSTTDAGPCSACHMVHADARGHALPAVQDDGPDPGGRCLTCHQPDGCAAHRLGIPLRHPALVDRSGLEAFRRRFGIRPPGASTLGAVATLAIQCADCHDPHAAGVGSNAFLRQPLNGLGTQEAASTGLLGSSTRGEKIVLRPQDPAESRMTKDESIGTVIPEATQQPVSDRSSGGVEVCAACHVEATHIRTSLHRPELLPELFPGGGGATPFFGLSTPGGGMTTPVCGPCHAVHATTPVRVAGTWNLPAPSYQGGSAAALAVGFDGQAKCGVCHDGISAVPIPPVPLHPPMVANLPFGVAGNWSLCTGNREGRPIAGGSISCGTCHEPHGRALPYELVDDQVAERSLDWVRANKPMLRAFQPPNLCTACHGPEGLKLFLEFHHRSPEPRAVSPAPPS